MKNIIVICEAGWIICGTEIESKAEYIKLTNASVVRSWRNGKGIGGLAIASNVSEYTLDKIGDVKINSNKILFTIPCEW